MTTRKTRLLARHRRKKRLLLFLALPVLAGIGLCVGTLWVFPLLLLAWVAHEAWFSDHLFYTPGADYQYRFGSRARILPTHFAEGRLTLADEAEPPDADDTLFLGLRLRCRFSGRFLDPAVVIAANGAEGKDAASADCQTFERGVAGLRYLNLTGFANTLKNKGLNLLGQHCRLAGEPVLWCIPNPDYRQKRLLVIAPHADDAELAAFGLYSQAKEVWIVTLTAGEIETEHYRRMGFPPAEAARIKGRLRAWDSIAVPLWGGVPPERCVQLGYFCLQLSAMRVEPEKAIPSREAELCDTRPFRCCNRIQLVGDADGVPSWKNLLADLRELMERARPEVIVLPHPCLDPHPDHVAAHAAVLEALRASSLRTQILLAYANNLHDTDHWPMGEAHRGVALPPLTETAEAFTPYVLGLDSECQRDKAMALAMMHDLAPRLPRKHRLRRILQRWLACRRHPPYGDNEYFRKAVRRHEVFFQETWK
ncbi:MAG: PIG-L family deacetylase [Azoarcus sp.]|nr:PIG-L family deacetylase [Azoarcus sp.]